MKVFVQSKQYKHEQTQEMRGENEERRVECLTPTCALSTVTDYITCISPTIGENRQQKWH